MRRVVAFNSRHDVDYDAHEINRLLPRTRLGSTQQQQQHQQLTHIWRLSRRVGAGNLSLRSLNRTKLGLGRVHQ